MIAQPASSPSQATANRSSAGISRAGCSVSGSHARAAHGARRRSSWRSRARPGGSARPVMAGTWLETAAHLVDHVIPPVPVRQWVISVPKRLRGMLADRPQAVAALTRIFLTEIARLLYALAGLPPDADTPRAARPRLGGISSLHRFGSALNHHVHRHACVTDGVFMPPIDGAGSDTAPVFRPARPITQLHLAALTERVRRRVIRWFRRSRLLDAAGESPRGRERAVSSSSRRLSSSIA